MHYTNKKALYYTEIDEGPGRRACGSVCERKGGGAKLLAFGVGQGYSYGGKQWDLMVFGVFFFVLSFLFPLAFPFS